MGLRARRLGRAVGTLLALALLFAFPIDTLAQDGGIAGTVRDDASGAPLGAVAIEVVGSGGAVVASGISGPGGTFRLNEVPAGSYTIRYVEDLIHAVACLDGIDLAWRDLAEQHERALMRSCQDRMEEADEVVLVRRFFASLRREPGRCPGDDRLTLSRYDGTSSLRRWIRGRLLDWLDEIEGVTTARLSLVGTRAAS